MAHQLQENDKMFSGLGIIPWHFNETSKDGRASVETGLLHPTEVVEKYLNWEMETGPLYSMHRKNKPNEDGIYDEFPVQIPGFKRIYRSDNPQNTLNITGEIFDPITNKRLAEIIASLTGDKANVETAGSLFGGENIWFLIPLSETILSGGNEMKNYLMVSCGKIGKEGKLAFRTVSVRVVCNNTFVSAIANGDNLCAFKQTKTLETRMQTKFDAIGWGNDALTQTFKSFEKMIETKVSDDEAIETIGKLFLSDKELDAIANGAAEMPTRTENNINDVYSLFLHGQGNNGSNLFDLFNGATEFADHARGTRVSSGVDENEQRFYSNLFTSGADFKQRAFDLTMALTV